MQNTKLLEEVNPAVKSVIEASGFDSLLRVI